MNNEKIKELRVFSTDVYRTGTRLKKLCAAKDISAKRLAIVFDISEQAVYSWFAGKKLPSPEYMKAIAAMLGMHMEDLYIDAGAVTPQECKSYLRNTSQEYIIKVV